MIQLNPRYEAIFNPDNIDQDCDGIASLMSAEADFPANVNFRITA